MTGVQTCALPICIRTALEKHGDRFLKRVFTDEERAYCDSLKFPHKHYAARWAAKEAVSKCFTTGIGPHLDDLVVELDGRDARVFLEGRRADLIASLNERMARASDEQRYEQAAVIRDQTRVEGRPDPCC